MQSWLPISANADFSMHNLPWGIFSTADRPRRVGVAIGDQIIDAAAAAKIGVFDHPLLTPDVFEQPYLNDFMALGREAHRHARERLQAMLQDATFQPQADLLLTPQAHATMHLPVQIGDYTDFYASEQHAFNVGSMFRDPANALLPNWKHLPVAYHGRASSIFVSGTNFRRPQGQICPDETQPPTFGPTRRLDFELEMGTVIGQGNTIGEAIPVAVADEYIFGFQLFNDWSARDIQKWEYVPLGPFLGKNFFSAISPWVVPIEALEPFRVPAPEQTPAVLPYLQQNNRTLFDVQLEVLLQPAGSAQAHVICRSNFANLYWSVAQQIAHHTINGCNLRVGDLLASGTISGREPDSFGSMLELAWGGKKLLALPGGVTRSFIEDGDTVIMRGFAEKSGIRVGFGEVKTTILPR